MLWEIALLGAGMTPKHIFKLSLTFLAILAGIHFGIDLGAKFDQSTGTTSTPAS